MLETIRAFLHIRPFKPFRIVMSNGKEYAIKSPDLVALGKTQITVYAPRSDRWSILKDNQIAFVIGGPNAA